jgi:N-acetylglucosaminyldiphosphoundecaprenol N-acetyl-beta-D-mannosaminyltransferase
VNEPFEFGPLSLAPLDPFAAVEWIVEAASAGRRSVVVTSNIHHLRLANADPAFRAAVSNAELNVADGWPLVAASRVLPGPSLPGRVAGVDLVERVLGSAVGLRVALLGGPPGAAMRLAVRVAERNEVVLVDELPKGRWEREDELASLEGSVARAAPNLTLIGIGAPKQELLASRLRHVARGPIVCCGAAIEIIAGVRPRAPRAVQQAGLEWGFRMLLEPQRLGPRYFRSARTFLRVLFEEFMRRQA